VHPLEKACFPEVLILSEELRWLCDSLERQLFRPVVGSIFAYP
jgi:hypothetical protein